MLLHIADGIEASGPVWASWAFPMERFCGDLQPAIKSRRFPWASIDRRILALSQLRQVQLLYELPGDVLLHPSKSEETLRRGEVQVPECAQHAPLSIDLLLTYELNSHRI